MRISKGDLTLLGDPVVAQTSLNSFDTGVACARRRREVPVANRRDEVFAVRPSPDGRRLAGSSVRSAQVLQSARRAQRRYVPSYCVHWRCVLSRCDLRASPHGRHDKRRIGSPLRLFWAHERVVSLQK